MNVDFNIINQKGSPAIFSDTYANRPAASYPGRLFISTDTKEIYRDTGSAWEEIAGSGSGNIQGSGTANYVPKFTDTETIGNSQIRDDGTGVGIGVAPSAVYYVDIGGSQRNTLSGGGGFTLRQSGSNVAAYGVYDSSSANAFLFSKSGTTNEIYSVGKIQHKIFDGATNYYISEFATGNFGVNTQTDAGYKLDVNGTLRVVSEALIQTLTVGLGGGSEATNTAIGYQAGLSNTSGTSITAIGYQALKANTTGAQNIAVGMSALLTNIMGVNNTAVGFEALLVNTNSSNTAMGRGALIANTTGSANTAFSLFCLSDNTTGIDNTSIGASTASGNFSGSLILGKSATATANNQCVFGSAGTNAGTVAAAVTAQANVWNVIINGTARQILLA